MAQVPEAHDGALVHGPRLVLLTGIQKRWK